MRYKNVLGKNNSEKNKRGQNYSCMNHKCIYQKQQKRIKMFDAHLPIPHKEYKHVLKTCANKNHKLL